MPIDYSKYPPNWLELRSQVLERAENKCEFCGVENYSMIEKADQSGTYKCVLTIAHLDHDEENHNVKIKRLAALCQPCHLRYDAPEKARRRKIKKYKNSLFPIIE